MTGYENRNDSDRDTDTKEIEPMRDDEQRMVFMVDADDNEIMSVCQHYQILFFPVVSVDFPTSLSGDTYFNQSCPSSQYYPDPLV